ncbi:MAG TPA: putative sulfate exporter family transporter, partial [Phycisphaeraceae bacterium]
MQTHPTRRRPLDVEEDLSWCVSLDSLEGVPLERSGDAEPRSSDHPGRGHRLLAWAGEVVPGVALALAIAVVADGLTHQVGVRLLGFASSPVSPILLAVVAGLLIRHLVGLPAVYEPGLRLCVRRVLRLGVALLGVRLSLQQIGALGLRGLPIILACMIAALALAGWASRGLRLPRRLGMLIAVGTSICGVSAVVATAPIIDAEEDQTSYAVATVALFGMIALL